MAAPIVYEGQLQGQGGTLFKDIKFWVAHRVPMRGTWLQNIENNGGTVVKLDKQADFIIADHARKDSPAGSYSWKWIEDSVKSGQLLDKTQYAISTPSRESRPVGSVQQKSTRTPFTRDDDVILAKFVTKKEALGIPTSGNVIYQELEAKYPHHTYQSWRDRWVRKVQHLSRPQVSDTEISPVTTPETPAAARPPPMQSATQRVSAATILSPHHSRDSASSISSPRKKTRAKFTPEEDQVLLEYVTELKAHGQHVRGQVAYQKFADDFPQHSWQAWRDRYVKILQPRESMEIEQTPIPSSVSRTARAAAVKRAARDLARVNAPRLQRQPVDKIEVEADVRQEDLKSEPPEDVEEPQQRNIHTARDGTLDGPEVDPLPSQTRLPQSSPRSFDKSPAPSQEEMLPATETNESLSKSTLERDQFYILLEELADPDTKSAETSLPWSTIRGRTIDLWDLWTEVQAQKAEPAERDWLQIAEGLDYNWVKFPSVPDEIRQCYESRLGFLSDYLDGAEDGEQESENESEDRPNHHAEVRNEAEMMKEGQESSKPTHLPPPGLPALPDLGSDGHFNSSPPKQPSLKRARDSAISSDLAYPEFSRKRQRLGRGDEVPSTPDTKNGTFHLRQHFSAGVSPSDRLRRTLRKSPHTAPRSRKARQADVEDERMQEHIRGSVSRARTQNIAIEPETQYFSFESQVVDDFDDEEFGDGETQEDALATPSQQLRSEIDAEERRQQLNQASPSLKRKAKSPFLPDDAEEGETSSLSKQPSKGSSSAAPRTEPLQAMPRSLFSSSAKGMKPLASARKSMPAASRTMSTQSASPHVQRRSPKPASPPPPRPRSKAEELEEVVEYWMSLGYSQDHSRRSLEAATWAPALAGQIMEQLKNGNAIPTNWEGVWTSRDDDALRLIDSPAAPRDEKEARKRRRAMERLQDKHGEERMELRRKWLVVKTGL